MCWLIDLFKAKPPTIERPSPKIRIKPEQVKIVSGTLVVTGLENCYVAAIAPTNSLDPTIDDGMFVIMDAGIPYTDIIIGDIIYYKSPTFEAIHRVIEIGADKDGWYSKCKGDNNSGPDPGLIRKEDIRGVWRATID